MKKKIIIPICQEMPDHFDFIKAAVDVVWTYHHDSCRSICYYDETIPTLMREARNRCDSLEKDFDRLKALERRIYIEKKVNKSKREKKAA